VSKMGSGGATVAERDAGLGCIWPAG